MNAPDDIVDFFCQKMTRDWAEALQAAQNESHLVCDGEVYPKIAYGDEAFRNPVEADHGPCRHCGTIKGKFHDHACDYEQCPRCGGQMMSCDCEFEGHEWRDEEEEGHNPPMQWTETAGTNRPNDAIQPTRRPTAD